MCHAFSAVAGDLTPYAAYTSPVAALDVILDDATVIPTDLCVEIHSRASARLDRVLGLDLQARPGVMHDLNIDPAARTIENVRINGDVCLVRSAAGKDDDFSAALRPGPPPG